MEGMKSNLAEQDSIENDSGGCSSTSTGAGGAGTMLDRACQQFNLLRPLFARVFCTPATSAPVERVFSASGLIMRAHRARMSDSLLEMLMMLKCNAE
jgi:hypothetical protein